MVVIPGCGASGRFGTEVISSIFSAPSGDLVSGVDSCGGW